LHILAAMPELEVLSLAKNPIVMPDNQARLTRRQLLRALVGLTCVDHRAVHPSERMYILQPRTESTLGRARQVVRRAP
jgi:hypothetical protein